MTEDQERAEWDGLKLNLPKSPTELIDWLDGQARASFRLGDAAEDREEKKSYLEFAGTLILAAKHLSLAYGIDWKPHGMNITTQ